MMKMGRKERVVLYEISFQEYLTEKVIKKMVHE